LNAPVVYVSGSGPGISQPTAPTPPIAPWLAVMRPCSFANASVPSGVPAAAGGHTCQPIFPGAGFNRRRPVESDGILVGEPVATQLMAIPPFDHRRKIGSRECLDTIAPPQYQQIRSDVSRRGVLLDKQPR